jgi:hypothetical protein
VPTLTLRRLVAGLLVLPLAAACTDQPLLPVPVDTAPPAMSQLDCSVDLRAGSMSCAPTPVAGGALLNRIIGGQEVYVRLASTQTGWLPGNVQFATTVTVQNLLQQSLGTDGAFASGVQVFFHSGPTVTGGTGSVEVANADGTEMFLGAPAPYFFYDQALEPYQVSAPRTWVFDVGGAVTSFRFSVYVSAKLPDNEGALLDRVWDGSASGAWETGDNWAGGVVPDSASTVAIPADSLFGGAHPVLAGDVELTHLRVGLASTLDLSGHRLTAWGNVDATGAIEDGLLRLGGSGVVVNGTLPSVRVTGSARLQGSVRANGPVSISDGSLNLAGSPLSIQIP